VVDRLVDLARRTGADRDPRLRDAVAQVWMDAEAYRLYTLADVTSIVEGRSPGARSSLNKLWWSEMDVRIHELALELLGPLAELSPEADRAVDRGGWMKGFQFALAGPIYAGTNEIQRNVVAERVLGLPRK
jgi:alkylation response protein AidB-like acyl-CoA dehydrogenase